jgi:CheY-like chemotaxis protein
MLRRLIGEDINLTWLPGAKLWPVNIDPSQIDQILANLCVNSRDAINGIGTISIQTEVATFDAEYCNNHAGVAAGDYVTLVVSDTGCGMDVEMQSIIFEPFFTTKGVGQGTGLGLASVYGAVTQNNGYINVYSEPGLGTTFRIYLPRCFCENNEVHKDHMGQSIVWGNETILLVEDDLSILNVTTMLLRNIGYNVLAASSPSDAMQLAREHIGDIDLLLTDVIMPEMNGRDLARNILTLYPNARSLFMSGYPIDIIANQGVLDAEVNFIRKPFSTINLADKLREVLEGLIAMDEVHNGTLFVPLNAK